MKKQIVRLLRWAAERLDDLADIWDYELHDELRVALKDPPIRDLGT